MRELEGIEDLGPLDGPGLTAKPSGAGKESWKDLFKAFP
jgi:hypothetical protein